MLHNCKRQENTIGLLTLGSLYSFCTNMRDGNPNMSVHINNICIRRCSVIKYKYLKLKNHP